MVFFGYFQSFQSLIGQTYNCHGNSNTKRLLGNCCLVTSQINQILRVSSKNQIFETKNFVKTSRSFKLFSFLIQFSKLKVLEIRLIVLLLKGEIFNNNNFTSYLFIVYLRTFD